MKLRAFLLSSFGILVSSFTSLAQTQAVYVNPATGTVTSPTPINFSSGQIKIGAISITTPTGTGAAVLATAPTLITPVLGVATATTLNGLTITSSTGTLTIPNSVTITAPAVTDTLVTLTATQTLTNKTLTAPALGVATAASLNGLTFTSGTNTYTITVGTASVTAPAGLSGTLGSGAFAPSMPAFLVNTGTATTLATGTAGQITWDTVIMDSAGGFAASAYTCPRAGVIELGFALYTGGDQWIFYVTKNGANISYLSYGEPASDIRQHGETVIQVAAGDVLELYGLQESGSPETNGVGDPTQQGFWGHYIY